MFCLRNFYLAAYVAIACMVLQPLTAQRADAQANRKNPFDGAKYWAYQLDNLSSKRQARIARSPFDLVVIDYAKGVVIDSTFGVQRQVPLSRSEVAAMQRKPDGSRRLIIAYLSIGEAENYRYYWDSRWNSKRKRPSWIGKESKEWEANYLVRYWKKEWQDIIFGNPGSYVDRILKAGFDGFYIDRADAYYRFGDTGKSRRRMTDFVVRLSRYIRSKKPDAAIMIQNAEELLTNRKFVEGIDAIAKEDLVYGISHREERNKQDDINWSTKLLERAKRRGKRIFVVEYLTKKKNIDRAKRYMDKRDYVLYYGPRGLFEIRESVVPGWKGLNGKRAAPTVVAVAKTPEPAPPPVSASPTDTAGACTNLAATTRTTGAIKFRTASSRLAGSSFSALDRIANSLQDCPGGKLQIGGHTDSDGSAKRNKRLSRKRAQSVMRYLVKAGAPRRRLVAVGYGQSQPIAPNNTAANKARNRRIEFKVVSR